MRHRLAVLAGLGLLLAGCAGPSAAGRPTMHQAPGPAVPSTEGACGLLDFTIIEQRLGVRLEVAAAERHGATRSCVAQPMAASRPDVTLAVTPTSIDAELYRDTLVPSGAVTVTGLGAAAYRHRIAAGRGYGPGLEIGWLSTDGRLITVRYTAAARTRAAAVDRLAAALLELARAVDRTRPSATAAPG